MEKVLYKARHTRERYSMKIFDAWGLTNSIRRRTFSTFFERAYRPLGALARGDILRRETQASAWRLARGAALCACVFVAWACQPPAAKETIWVTIPPDALLEGITDSLVANRIIESPRAFQKLARIGRAYLDIKPGLYDFQPSTPIGEVLVRLRKGTDPVKRMVIPKGIWLTEVAAQIERDMGIDREAFMAAASSRVLLSRLGARGESLEGYIYPSVYYLRLDASVADILDQLADTFEIHWDPGWDQRSDFLGLTRDEVVTLASIIEGERPAEEDLLEISSVYHNRLNRGMRLQADPTIVFALGERRRLFNRDYATDSPFNTYLIDGLPPSPIGNPSSASIAAALYPDSTEFFYFVAQPDGRHRFSVTYEEHLQAIGEIRGEVGELGRQPN